MTAIKICIVCNKEFIIPLVRIYTAKYCSNKCRSKTVKKICEICNSEYVVPLCRENTAKYCSQKCKKIGAPLTKRRRIKIRCNYCENETYKIPSDLDKKYCGWKCKSLAQKGMFSESHPSWKGGKHICRGYVYKMRHNHPRSIKGYVTEHTLVMEQSLGRYLVGNECVHHINGKRDDNRIENLKLVTVSEHARIHWSGYGNPKYVDGRCMKQTAGDDWK